MTNMTNISTPELFNALTRSEPDAFEDFIREHITSAVQSDQSALNTMLAKIQLVFRELYEAPDIMNTLSTMDNLATCRDAIEEAFISKQIRNTATQLNTYRLIAWPVMIENEKKSNLVLPDGFSSALSTQLVNAGLITSSDAVLCSAQPLSVSLLDIDLHAMQNILLCGIEQMTQGSPTFTLPEGIELNTSYTPEPNLYLLLAVLRADHPALINEDEMPASPDTQHAILDMQMSAHDMVNDWMQTQLMSVNDNTGSISVDLPEILPEAVRATFLYRNAATLAYFLETIMDTHDHEELKDADMNIHCQYDTGDMTFTYQDKHGETSSLNKTPLKMRKTLLLPVDILDTNNRAQYFNEEPVDDMTPSHAHRASSSMLH